MRRAVALMDAGDAASLRAHLAAYPDLVHRRVHFPGGGYFAEPTLLEFVAENPVRHGAMPRNVVEVARILLDAGASKGSAAATLGLVASGRVPREQGAQVALIDLLCARGADPNAAMPAAIAHGEWQAVEALLANGAGVSLFVAAALGRLDEARDLLPEASGDERHLAFAFACQFGRPEIVRLLLDAGEDPNRFNPAGAHGHSTPLHQAVLRGEVACVKLLLERGARSDLRDKIWSSTPLDWAIRAKNEEIATFLREWRVE